MVYGQNPPGEKFRYVRFELLDDTHAQCYYEFWSLNQVWAPWPLKPGMVKRCAQSDTFGCGKSVKDIKAVLAKPQSDPTSLFHNNQICIAEESCVLKCEMQNCKWLDLVIPAFLDPYINKSGKWKQIESECYDSSFEIWPWANSRRCSNSMAFYHIGEDLTSALAAHGCGSESDWDQVFDVIKLCNREHLSFLESKFVNQLVRLYRESTRGDCIEDRTAAMKAIEIDLGLEGRQCFAL